MDNYQDTRFTLADIEASPTHNTLSASHASVKLQPKAMAVLHYLACNHSRVVGNEELIEQLWPGRVVTHASVQKSINALRSALSQLGGEKEFIAHFSKRGYQLTVTPQFHARSSDASIPSTTPLPGAAPVRTSRKWLASGAAILLFIALFLLYHFVSWAPDVTRRHQTAFNTIRGFTNETGHERTATPHPDNQHLAYIRDRAAASGTESDIVIRYATGEDWRVADTNGSWFKLAWSPAGNNLVAIEVQRRDGVATAMPFYHPTNQLYSFHIFTLDLAAGRVLEKQQLSQWQGQIFSVTWWDEGTLEIVAKQGPGSGNARYRYSIVDQKLTLLDELENATNPVASAVRNQQTAIASSHKHKIHIDFLNMQQERIKRVKLDVTTADVSWIPDGSGVLVFAEEERKLSAVYLDDEHLNIPLADSKDRTFLHPHYSADGTGIFYTEEQRSANILLATIDGEKNRLTDNNNLNYAASFSPTNDRIVYASVRSNQIHLWLIENGEERQLTKQPVPQKVDRIIWSDDGEHVVFNAANQIFHHALGSNQTALLVTGTDDIEPITYFPETNRLFTINDNGGVRNIWRTEGEQQKQLTFGSVGSAIGYAGDIYFQYVSENGLWVWRGENDSLERLTPNLPAHSNLLRIDNEGIYFISGGTCDESPVYYHDFATASTGTFLVRQNRAVVTTSFKIDKGLLYTECTLPEANIVLMK